jgi:hypothetical protein
MSNAKRKRHTLRVARRALRGFVIDRGISPIDGQPYVAILTLKSENVKTGNMCQVFIIRPDLHPLEAIASGADRTICGDCPHRRRQVWDAKRKRMRWVRSCYVDVGKSVGAVWRAFARGSYPEYDPSLHARYIRGRRIRWGTYGDPAILTETVVRDLNAIADGHTGYTHQWRQPWAQWAVGLFQASCDSFADYLAASDAGWRTFAVVAQGAAPFSGKLCPATAEGSQAQCLTCRLCDGAKTDVFVEAHGVGASFVGV